MKIYLTDPKATHQLGVILGQILIPGSTLLLEGDLGSGKTTLVKGIGEGLGLDELIASPTFTLINEYEQGRIPLYHLDLYRLQSHQVEGLYLETYWEGIEVNPGIMAIEWAERLPYLPESYLQIRLSYTANTGRCAELIPCKFDFNTQQIQNIAL